MELREYRKRVSLTTTNLNRTPSGGVPTYLTKGLATNGNTNLSDINFQFEFPKFGPLPASPPANGTSQSISPGTTAQKAASPVEKSQPSPLNRNTSYKSANGSTAGLNQTPIDSGDMSGFSGLFSPSLLESVSKSSSSSFDFFSEPRSSTASNGQMSNGQSTSHSSPSASSNSNRGASSSCGTSPEPSMQSPASGKTTDPTLSTIGEEHTGNPQGETTFCDKLNMACGNASNPIPRTMSESSTGNFVDPGFDGIDWFAQQNGNLFDPQLFGDYREPQENILSGDGFNDGFFNDAFAMPEFNSPYNLAPTPPTTRKDKLANDGEVVPADDGQFLNCNTIWYVPLAVYLTCRLVANILVSGIGCKLAPRLRRASSILTSSAKISRRKPSVRRLALSSTKPILTRS
jgi:AP-1-like factor